MADYSNERIKKSLEKAFGDIGVQMFQTSISNLKLHEKSSKTELEKLKADIKDKLSKLYGAAKAEEFINDLNTEFIEEEKSIKFELKDVMDNFYKNKGIPAESDIHSQARDLISKGYKADESKLSEILKQLSKEKIISALNDSIINNEIKAFLDKYQSYTQSDVQDLINYMTRIAKLRINEGAVKDMIEMERLYRKFNDLGGQEEPWQLKICRQYIALLGSSKKSDYQYLILDEAQAQLLKKIAS